MTTQQPRLYSESVIVEAPMSFTGAKKRVMKWTHNLLHLSAPRSVHPALRITLDVFAWMTRFLTWTIVPMWIGMWWMVIAAWYCAFGLLLVPFRLIRRSSRSQKRDRTRHAEMLSALASKDQ